MPAMALINQATGMVVNVIEVEDQASLPPLPQKPIEPIPPIAPAADIIESKKDEYVAALVVYRGEMNAYRSAMLQYEIDCLAATKNRYTPPAGHIILPGTGHELGMRHDGEKFIPATV